MVEIEWRFVIRIGRLNVCGQSHFWIAELIATKPIISGPECRKRKEMSGEQVLFIAPLNATQKERSGDGAVILEGARFQPLNSCHKSRCHVIGIKRGQNSGHLCYANTMAKNPTSKLQHQSFVMYNIGTVKITPKLLVCYRYRRFRPSKYPSHHHQHLRPPPEKVHRPPIAGTHAPEPRRR